MVKFTNVSTLHSPATTTHGKRARTTLGQRIRRSFTITMHQKVIIVTLPQTGSLAGSSGLMTRII